jgi:hypothetical protein
MEIFAKRQKQKRVSAVFFRQKAQRKKHTRKLLHSYSQKKYPKKNMRAFPKKPPLLYSEKKKHFFEGKKKKKKKQKAQGQVHTHRIFFPSSVIFSVLFLSFFFLQTTKNAYFIKKKTHSHC